MTELTTAQRLSAYHNELIAETFTEEVADEFLKAIVPRHIEDLIVKADIEDENPPIGVVHIHMRPQLDEEDIARAAQEVQRRVSAGSPSLRPQ